MISFVQKLLSCPIVVLSGIAAISFFSLAAALTAEVAFGLEPCILCIYQRIPFAAALLLSITGIIILSIRGPVSSGAPPTGFALCKIQGGKRENIARYIIAICGVAFLANSAIAFYHTGVELKWWRSAVEGCAAPIFGDNPQSILENILSAPTARCDEIPWADPILGLSMANYNVIMCFGLSVVCALAFIRQLQAHSKQQTP